MADSAPWDGCVVSFHTARQVDISDVNHCDELPRGWLCLHSGPRSGLSFTTRHGFVVEFSVACPTERDGRIVRHILQRLVAL